MGVRNIIENICDFPECKSGQNGGPVVSLVCVEDVQSGKTPLPEESKTFVVIGVGNQKMAFCCRLHAAKFFLPPGYEIRQSGLVEFPKQNWTGPEIIPEPEPLNPDNGQEAE